MNAQSDDRRSDDGFTMAEVIVAAGLLVVVSTAAMILITRLIAASNATQMRIAATNVAQQDIEQMRDFNNASNSAGIVSVAAKTITVGSRTYMLTRTVSPSGGCTTGSTRTVTSSVSWSGASSPIVLATVLAC